MFSGPSRIVMLFCSTDVILFKCSLYDELFLLQQATCAFEGLKQSSSLKSVIKPLSSSLVKHGLLVHKDKDIRLLVGICFCEIVRVLAPNPEFSDAVSRVKFDFVQLFLLYGPVRVTFFFTPSPFWYLVVAVILSMGLLTF